MYLLLAKILAGVIIAGGVILIGILAIFTIWRIQEMEEIDEIGKKWK